MSNLELLKRLGLYIDTCYLDADECRNIIEESRLGNYVPATVADRSYSMLNEEIRRTKVLQLSPSTLHQIEQKLLTCKPNLEQKFNVSLTACQTPQLLHYKKGDFFMAHADTNDLPSTDKYIRDRRVSAVIFLNERKNEPGELQYSGGSLDLYGLIKDDPKWEKYGFPVFGTTGMLVAFPSHLIHEVKPVIDGDRYTIVTWFV